MEKTYKKLNDKELEETNTVVSKVIYNKDELLEARKHYDDLLKEFEK